MKTLPAKLRSLRQAFTLVETTIAMGIVAFAMVPILGLVPMGLTTFRNAISYTAEAQIVQGLSNEILLTDYDLVEDKYSSTQISYYSDEGELLASASEAGAIYQAKVDLQDIAAPSASSVTPSASKCALIEISNIAHPGISKKYSLVIPKG
jgi:uncharacterized protein (TIGR02598 family)